MEHAPEDKPIQSQAPPPRLSLKEAAERTGRSVTTLRRYIRAMRLRAEKTPGRFGPEYTLDEASLRAAGFEPTEAPAYDSTASAPAGPTSAPGFEPGRPARAREGNAPREPEGLVLSRPLEKVLQDFVPADLYRELAMKHEQLLVQYGMVRASGQRLFEFREEAENRAEELRLSRERQKETQDRASREIGFLRQHLRQAELEIEQRNQDLSHLRDKVRVLELLTRNAVMTESIEQQFLRIYEKEREVETLLSPAPFPSPFPSTSASSFPGGGVPPGGFGETPGSALSGASGTSSVAEPGQLPTAPGGVFEDSLSGAAPESWRSEMPLVPADLPDLPPALSRDPADFMMIAPEDEVRSAFEPAEGAEIPETSETEVLAAAQEAAATDAHALGDVSDPDFDDLSELPDLPDLPDIDDARPPRQGRPLDH